MPALLLDPNQMSCSHVSVSRLMGSDPEASSRARLQQKQCRQVKDPLQTFHLINIVLKCKNTKIKLRFVLHSVVDSIPFVSD